MVEIVDREHFWAILLNLTKNKAIDHFRRETRQKRGGDFRRVTLASEDAEGSGNSIPDSQTLEDREAVELLDHFKHLLDTEDPSGTLSSILLTRLAGESNKAIGVALGISTRTVDRKIERIRLVLESSSE